MSLGGDQIVQSIEPPSKKKIPSIDGKRAKVATSFPHFIIVAPHAANKQQGPSDYFPLSGVPQRDFGVVDLAYKIAYEIQVGFVNVYLGDRFLDEGDYSREEMRNTEWRNELRRRIKLFGENETRSVVVVEIHTVPRASWALKIASKKIKKKPQEPVYYSMEVKKGVFPKWVSYLHYDLTHAYKHMEERVVLEKIKKDADYDILKDAKELGACYIQLFFDESMTRDLASYGDLLARNIGEWFRSLQLDRNCKLTWPGAFDP